MNLNNRHPSRRETKQRHRLFKYLDQWIGSHLPSEQVVHEGKVIHLKGHADYLGKEWGTHARFNVIGTYNNYQVNLYGNLPPTCTCPGGQHRPTVMCKHRVAAVMEAMRLTRARGHRARGVHHGI